MFYHTNAHGHFCLHYPGCSPHNNGAPGGWTCPPHIKDELDNPRRYKVGTKNGPDVAERSPNPEGTLERAESPRDPVRPSLLPPPPSQPHACVSSVGALYPPSTHICTHVYVCALTHTCMQKHARAQILDHSCTYAHTLLLLAVPSAVPLTTQSYVPFL